MPFYNFKKDFGLARLSEGKVKIALENNGWEYVSSNNNADYDLQMKDVEKDKIYTFEVKEDFMCAYTGNVGLEYDSRGKPSGISISKADFYAYVLHRPLHIKQCFIQATKALKRKITNKQYFRIVNGGDKDSNTLMYLFKYDVFIRGADLLYEEQN